MKTILKALGVAAVTIIAVLLEADSKKHKPEPERKQEPFSHNNVFEYFTYSDAIAAVMQSDMTGYMKTEAVKRIDKNGTSEYYRAVCNIIWDDDLTGYSRVELIKAINE